MSSRPVTVRWFAFVAIIAIAAGLYTEARGQSDGSKKPTITIKSVPSDPPGEQMASEHIKGTVSNVSPKDYKVVIYAYGDKWYIQPTMASPFTDIEDDKTWENETHGGWQFAALLVKPSFNPAATLGSLPAVGGEVVAIAKKKPEKKP